MRTNTLIVRTPEGILFPLLLAGPVTRFMAWFVDGVCIMVILQTIMLGLTLLQLVSGSLAAALQYLGFFVVSTGYGIVLEWWWRGQTVGKRLLRLRVMDAQGLRLQPSQIIIRNLLRFVDCLPLPYLVGGIAVLLSRRAQRLGDFAANTIVVRQPKTTAPDLDQLLAGKYNSFNEHPHLTARLRQRVSPAEAGIALQALLRRDELEPAARVELFRELADHFRAVTPFPAETTEGLPDEQYVRNVVDVVFRQ
jgi:uncharacterized RDD family membrane protein YckC